MLGSWSGSSGLLNWNLGRIWGRNIVVSVNKRHYSKKKKIKLMNDKLL